MSNPGPDPRPTSPTESAVLVAVPEAEEVVGPFRARLDHSAAWGVPAHVTVLYPFIAPNTIDGPALRRLTEAVDSVPAFDVTLARLRWFGDTVLWLAPTPDTPFRELTAAVWSRFPHSPPYGGAVADPLPHLTVGQDAPVDVLRDAAKQIEPLLPVRAHITAVHVMCGAPRVASWRTVARLPLAAR
jgi:2'-5' RNA ligase